MIERPDKKKFNLKILFVGLWMVFTFSLAGWWIVPSPAAPSFRGIAQSNRLAVASMRLCRQIPGSLLKAVQRAAAARVLALLLRAGLALTRFQVSHLDRLASV